MTVKRYGLRRDLLTGYTTMQSGSGRYVLFIDHEADKAEAIAVFQDVVERLPDQATIDAVAEGLAKMLIDERDWLAQQPPLIQKCYTADPAPCNMLLKLLGIKWAASALDTHHDGPAELVKALRQLKELKGEDDGDSANGS